MRTGTLLAVSAQATCLLIASSLAAAAVASPSPPDGKGARSSVSLSLLGTHATGVFDQSASEITAHDPSTQRLFVVNAASGTVDVLDVSDPASPTRLFTLQTAGLPSADGSTVDAGAVVNSVDVRDGVLAVAVAAADKVSPGWVAFFSTSGPARFRSVVRAGSLPDMLAFTPDGRSVLVANEGEPADDFSSDPEGSVSIVDVTGGARSLSQRDVRTATFGVYDGRRELADGVRVFGPDVAVPPGQEAAGRVARNLEPEYLTVDRRSRTAWVTLQEANAIAVLDLRSGEFTAVRAIPPKNWSEGGNTLDVSNQDDTINLESWPVQGLSMPDAISSYEVRGRTFLVTANEGDAREWGDYVEPARVGDLELCPDAFRDAATLQQDEHLGRLNVTTADGQRAGGCYEELYAFGGRSLSVFDANGRLVFDSGAVMEEKIVELIEAGELPEIAFNANHAENPSFDNRSDDKGIEPEGVTVGKVDGRTYAFVGLERIGGVMVFDVTDPRSVTYVDYVNNRNWSAEYEDDGVGAQDAGDLGTEGVELIGAKDSPTGRPVLAVANEVSGTTSLFSVDRAQRPKGKDHGPGKGNGRHP